jgi:hypothetical protein
MRRIFGLKEAVHANDDPSDVVPGFNDDGHPSSSCLSCGGEEGPQGLDCVLGFSFEVIVVKSQGPCCISCTWQSPLCNLSHRLIQLPVPSGLFRLKKYPSDVCKPIASW